MNTTAKILTAFAAGAAIGAVAGILFAPDKGSETRKKMEAQGKQVAEELKNKVKEVAKKCNCAKEDLRQKAEEFSL
jgi:gas vesicle protein